LGGLSEYQSMYEVAIKVLEVLAPLDEPQRFAAIELVEVFLDYHGATRYQAACGLDFRGLPLSPPSH
jgi:hypothetical protein